MDCNLTVCKKKIDDKVIQVGEIFVYNVRAYKNFYRETHKKTHM